MFAVPQGPRQLEWSQTGCYCFDSDLSSILTMLERERAPFPGSKGSGSRPRYETSSHGTGMQPCSMPHSNALTNTGTEEGMRS